jgi:hypothetical protein
MSASGDDSDAVYFRQAKAESGGWPRLPHLIRARVPETIGHPFSRTTSM